MKRGILLAAVVTWLGAALPAAADDPDSSGLFKKLDVNGDGKLTAAEIPQEHQKAFERLLRIGDADKNGELTRDEFDRGANKKETPVTDISKVGGGPGKGPRGDMDPKRMFEMLDKNGDGKITRDEAEGRPRITEMLNRLGKDEITLADLPGGERFAKGKGPEGKGKKGAGNEPRPDENAGPPEGGRPGHPPFAPKFVMMLDANHDGRVTKEELAKAGDLFDELDENKDGHLDFREILGPPPGGNDEAMAGRLARMKGRPGIGGRPNGPPGSPDGAPGAKTAEPGGPEGAGNAPKGKRDLGALMKRADKNGDGKISEEEAPPRLKERFSQIDKNGDGALDADELAASMKQKAAGKPGGKGKKPAGKKPEGEKTSD